MDFLEIRAHYRGIFHFLLLNAVTCSSIYYIEFNAIA